MLKPKYTMRDIYGDVVFSARPAHEINPWMPSNEKLNALSARETLIADVPVLVHEATQTDKAKKLFDLASIPFPEQPYTYKNKEEYNAILKQWGDEKKEVVLQYIHGKKTIDRDAYWMDAKLLNYLNSKAYLREIVPEKYVPEREVIDSKDLEKALEHWELPFVLKPGDETPTAGGYGVQICHTEEQLAEAKKLFTQEGADHVIIEKYVKEIENYSCQYAYSENIGLQYLGTSVQITDDEGVYAGNVMIDNVPEAVIQAGREIMQAGVDKGYIGIAGFDLLWTEEGEVKAIDLNFRLNGSTSMLMYAEALDSHCMKFYTYDAIDKEYNDAFYNLMADYIAQDVLLPLSYYDGDAVEGGAPSSFVCIWHAFSLEDIELYEESLFKSGAVAR